MKKINELKAGALLSYVNLGISTIIPFFYTPIMLRLMGQAEYGLYSLANSVISYLSLLTFGMGGAVIRYITKFRAEKKKEAEEGVIGLFLIFYCIAALLVCVIGIVIILNTKTFFSKGLTTIEINKLKVLVIIMTLSTAVSFPVSVISSVVVAHEKYIFQKSIDIISSSLLPVINLIILSLGYRSIGLSLVGLFMQISYGIIYIIYCMNRLQIKPRFDNMPFELGKEIFSFSCFIFIGMIADLLYWSTDKVLIGAMIGSTAVAVYNVGGVFTTMLQNMSGAISNVFVPKITSMVVLKNDTHELSELLIRIGRIQYYIVSLIITGFAVFGKNFIHYWSGDKYMDSYYIALITMIPIAVPLIQNIAYNIILAQNKHSFRSIMYLVIAVVNMISTYLVIPRYGIIGAALCTCFAYLIGNGLILNIYYWKNIHLEIPLFWKNIINNSIVPILMLLVGSYFINHILIPNSLVKLCTYIIAYTCIYFILSWFISMNEYEKKLFKSIFIKFIH